jgi:hypothetical protein
VLDASSASSEAVAKNIRMAFPPEPSVGRGAVEKWRTYDEPVGPTTKSAHTEPSALSVQSALAASFRQEKPDGIASWSEHENRHQWLHY